MKNLKVRMKLLVGFGVVLIMLVAIVVSSIWGMGELAKTVDVYKNDSLPNVETMWNMRRDLLSVQRYLLTEIAAVDEKVITEAETKLEEDTKSLNELIVKFEQTTSDPEKLKEFTALVANAGEIRKKMKGDIALRTDEGNTRAFETFLNEYKPTFDSAAKILVDFTTAQQEDIEQRGVEADATTNSAYIILIAVAAIAFVATIIMVILITKAITTPIREIENAAEEMENGNLKTEIKYKSRDELGVLAESMRNSMGKIQGYIEVIDRSMNEMATGNFDIPEPEVHFVGDFKNIENSINKLTHEMSDTLSQIITASEQVSSGSDQVSNGAQSLAQGATEQASSVEELSASIADITENVKQNAQSSAQASIMANDATKSINDSNIHMQKLMDAMTDINAKSSEISKIIKTIDDIAFQTNILALNAAVEAARAGEAGKGFAVVADEVRNLASKSAEAAKNTTGLIEASVVSIENGVKLAGDTAKELLSVVEGSRATTEIIDQISKVTNEQSTALTQVAMGVEQISTVVQSNSAISEESAAASEELSSQANMLKRLVAKFKLKNQAYSARPLLLTSDKKSTGAEVHYEEHSSKY